MNLYFPFYTKIGIIFGDRNKPIGVSDILYCRYDFSAYYALVHHEDNFINVLVLEIEKQYLELP
jgi:hypothetical protein